MIPVSFILGEGNIDINLITGIQRGNSVIYNKKFQYVTTGILVSFILVEGNIYINLITGIPRGNSVIYNKKFQYVIKGDSCLLHIRRR